MHPIQIISQKPLVPSVASNKCDNEMILGAVHRSPGICLIAEQNPRKSELGDRLMKGLCDLSSPQMRIPYFLMKSVGSHCTSGRKKEGKRKMAGM